jgi:hypothetical protein
MNVCNNDGESCPEDHYIAHILLDLRYGNEKRESDNNYRRPHFDATADEDNIDEGVVNNNSYRKNVDNDCRTNSDSDSSIYDSKNIHDVMIATMDGDFDATFRVEVLRYLRRIEERRKKMKSKERRLKKQMLILRQQENAIQQKIRRCGNNITFSTKSIARNTSLFTSCLRLIYSINKTNYIYVCFFFYL